MKKFLLFISPVYWEHPNKQTQYSAEELSKHYKILFFDVFRMQPVGVLQFLKNRWLLKKYVNQFILLFNNKESILKSPIFLTLFTYQEPCLQLKKIDELFLVIQISLFSLILNKSFKFPIWSNTYYFPGLFKIFKNHEWYFDFYDRNYDFIDKKLSAAFRDRENWLVLNSKKIFVNSKVFIDFCNSILNDKDLSQQKLVKVPVGYQLFDEKRYSDVVGDRRTVVYAGGLTARIDYQLVLETVKKNPQLRFIFSGEIGDDRSWSGLVQKESPATFLKKLKKFPNVSILRSTLDVDNQARRIRSGVVGWIPYDTTVPFNRHCMPTKLWEYWSLGLAVITTDLPTLAAFNKCLFIQNSSDQFKKLFEDTKKDEFNYKKKIINLCKKNNLRTKMDQVIKIMLKK